MEMNPTPPSAEGPSEGPDGNTTTAATPDPLPAMQSPGSAAESPATKREKGTRRPHSKTKTGCQVCKARKVKCDETRPSCKNCRKRGIRCDFSSAAENSSRHQHHAGSFAPADPTYSGIPLRSPDPSAPDSAPSSAPSPYPPAITNNALLASSSSSFPFSVLDLELLHHFTTSTCFTFSTDPSVRGFWRVNLPQLGFANPFLLRAILSLAALHMARYRQHEHPKHGQLLEAAMSHHSAACSLAAPLISALSNGGGGVGGGGGSSGGGSGSSSNNNSESTIPIFFFSIITLYIACASPKEEHNHLLMVSANGLIPQWLLLFRGVRLVLDADRGQIDRSSLGMMLFHTGRQMSEIWGTSAPKHEALDDLEVQFRTHLGGGASSGSGSGTEEGAAARIRRAEDHYHQESSERGGEREQQKQQQRQQKEEAKLQALRTAIDSLRRSYQFVNKESSHGEEQRVRGVLVWMFKAEDDFVALLRQNDSDALCVLAYYCVLLQRISYHWWLEGWGVHLIRHIYGRLDELRRSWVRWPVEEIGWVP